MRICGSHSQLAEVDPCNDPTAKDFVAAWPKVINASRFDFPRAIQHFLGLAAAIRRGARNRPALQAAIADCRLYGAKLVIAKLNRLSRDPVFLLSLRDAGIEFVAVDMPHANRLTVGIMALVAEQERSAISKRTKDRWRRRRLVASGLGLGRASHSSGGCSSGAWRGVGHCAGAGVC